MRYLARRLLWSLAVLVGLSLLTFVAAELAPGDFLAEMRLDPRISPETLAALRQRYGLDQPLPVRYLRWLESLAAGELGYSFAHDMPVGPLLLPRARNTLLLGALATFLAWAIALPLGTLMAAHAGGLVDRLGLLVESVLLAVPQLLLGLGCLLLASRTGAFPVGGMSSLGSEKLPVGRALLEDRKSVV